QRFVTLKEHGWGPWFFIPVVIGGSWPWLFFALAGFCAARENSNPGTQSALRFLAIWFGLIFVLFSIPRAKLGSYILPAMPPVALVAGLGLSTLESLGRDRVVRTLRNFMLINLIAGTVMIVSLFELQTRIGLALAHEAMFGTAIVMAGSVVAWIFGRSGRVAGHVFATLVFMMVAATNVGDRARFDAGSETTYRELASQITPHLQACVLASYRHFVQSMPFYTGQREVFVQYRGELAPFA